MSYSSPLGLVQLQKLKLWQGSYDNILQQSRRNSQSADKYCGDNVSLENSPSTSTHSIEKEYVDSKDWDKKKISPAKPFELLLEEKIAEDTPVIVNSKPKRPFLKKGQGLARFKMGTTRPVSNKIAGSKKQASRLKTRSPERKGILKKTNPLYHQDVDLSPLTVPDFVKPRGTWKQVFENAEQTSSKPKGFEEEQGTLENYDEFRKSLGSGECRIINSENKSADDQLFKTSSSKHVLETAKCDSDVEKEQKEMSASNFASLDKEMLQKVQEYAKNFFEYQNVFLSNDIPENLEGLVTPKMPKQMGDLTLEELKMEKELKIFEVLEKKVDQSSFCSTSSSIANLLASTPQKATRIPVKDQIIEEQDEHETDSVDISVNSVFPRSVRKEIQMKIREVSQKTDVLHNFLMNLRNMEQKKDTEQNYSIDSDTTGKKVERSMSANTSFSDENTRWSTRSPSLSDNYTELDTTCRSDNWRKVDAGVNTSFDKLEETVRNMEPCRDCEDLRSKYTEIKIKLSDVRLENSSLKMELKDLEKQYDKLKRTSKKNEENYEQRLEKLENELDFERKKIAREKAYFETYVKDAQNRPSKKEREEITQLKQELVDVKELLKLKDTKSGATQARLRTQIKQQEKELTEMKTTVEKLQRENAKLTANQKYARRPQEVKMLHEINKNLSKLAEETLKKQLNKSGDGDSEIKEPAISRTKPVGNGENCDKENKKGGKTVDNKDVKIHTTNRTGGERYRSDSSTFEDTRSEGLTLEQQYELMFGNFNSPRNVNISTSVEKTETTLPDGSIEIMYSNGNVKTISADGKLIKMKYFNGDTKETDLKEQVIKYHYAAADSWHIQYPDGKEVMEFKDGQKCTKYIDGKTEVSYSDGSLRLINPDGTEEQSFPDGRKTIKNLQGEQIILLPNGQKEIHTQHYKRREYPDGTIRTLHKDGSVETVYANGRVRLKDSSGVLIMDTLQT